MSDFEKLINASDLFDWIMETYPDWCVGAIRGIFDHIKEMPSAHPEDFEWCKGCKEYDHERGCCPRFNKVIKDTVDEVKQNLQIVYCIDCDNFTPGKDEWGACSENPMKAWRTTDFCSWGERKES